MLDPRRCGCFHIMAPYQTGWPVTDCPAADGHTGKGRADAERLAARERLADGDIFDHRPGRAAIMITRWERNTASWIEWVTNTTVRFCSLPETQQVAVEFVTRNFIQRAEGLIHQQQLWSGDRRGRWRRAFACRRSARQDVGELAEAHQLKIHPGIALRPRAGQIQRQPDVMRTLLHGIRVASGRRTTADAGPFPTVAPPQHQLAVAGLHGPATIFSRVLLPQPDGPSNKLPLIDGQVDGQQRRVPLL